MDDQNVVTGQDLNQSQSQPWGQDQLPMQSQDVPQEHHHRRDPAEGGWDTTILKAPDSHKAGSRRRHRRERELSTGARVLRIVGIVLLVLVGIAAAVALGLFIALKYTGSM